MALILPQTQIYSPLPSQGIPLPKAILRPKNRKISSATAHLAKFTGKVVNSHKIEVEFYACSNFHYKLRSHPKTSVICRASMCMKTTLVKGEVDQESICVEDSNYIAFLLQKCVESKSLELGKAVHAVIIKTLFESDLYLENNLVAMYAKLKNLEDARQVFDRMPQRNMVSWTAMISGYAKSGRGEDALDLFVEMLRKGVEPNDFTFMSVLAGCVDMAGLEEGKQIHVLVIKSGFDSYVHVNNALLAMYSKSGDIEDARQLFDKMLQHNGITWNTMIAGYAQNGQGDEALQTFGRMWMTGIRPDQFGFSSVLVAISTLSFLEEGRSVHGHVVRTGFGSNTTVNNALITMYARCGDTENAARVFNKMPTRDVVSWTSMITGYVHQGNVTKAFQLFQEMPDLNSVSYSAMIAGLAQNGEGEKALQLFQQMQQAGINSTHFTLASVLNACADLATMKRGKQLHAHVIKTGIEASVCVGSALVDMYGKCGVVPDAYKVFEKMPERNIVSWNGMITGYAQNGQGEEALNLFVELQREHVIMDRYILASVLGACGALGAMGEGRHFHAQILKYGLGLEGGIGNALVTMYVKCGSIEDAIVVFSEMPDRDIVSWNAMITGFAQHGYGKEALHFFQQMQGAGINPNSVTFVGVLAACRSLGLVDEGRYYFDSMSKCYGINSTVEHYACMVDILGRAGQLDEAKNFINQMPCEPSTLVWRSLFRACRFHCNVELAKYAAENIIKLEPEDPATYALVANIYASVGWWDAATKVRRMMKTRGVKKLPARSWIFSKNRLHSFLVRDKMHPQIEDIHTKLDELITQIKEAGYVPDTSTVLHDVESYHKEHFLMHHSEKLALAFGLLITLPGIPIYVTKSVRVCKDCHTFTKFVSKIVGREIILRDASGFHYFRDGYCLCGDYW